MILKALQYLNMTNETIEKLYMRQLDIGVWNCEHK